MSVVYVRSITAAAALAAAAAVCAAVLRVRRLRRCLARERATARLTAGCLHRDLDAFRSRIEGLVAQRSALDEADLVLDAALAAHHVYIDPTTEGGPG